MLFCTRTVTCQAQTSTHLIFFYIFSVSFFVNQRNRNYGFGYVISIIRTCNNINQPDACASRNWDTTREYSVEICEKNHKLNTKCYALKHKSNDGYRNEVFLAIDDIIMNMISLCNSAVCKGNFMVYMILEALLGKISIVSWYESKCMLQRTRHKKDCVRELGKLPTMHQFKQALSKHVNHV